MWKYETRTEWRAGTQDADITLEQRPPLEVTPPKEFGGDGKSWSPEDMLTGALESCYLLSALYHITRAKIALASYSSHAVATMERTAEGLRFTDFEIAIDARPEDPAQAHALREAIERAEKTCPVSGSLKTPVRLTVSCQV